MKVYNLTSRKVEAYNDSYAARLIEQGRAVLYQEKPAPRDKATKTEEAPKDAPHGADSFAKGKATSAGGK